MNIWTVKSIELANKEDYLDRLFEIYPIKQNPERFISDETKGRAAELLQRHEDFQLINLLLDLERFPIKHSYASYLKRDRSAMERNPQVVAKIAEELHKMGLNLIIENIKAPKETNRQLGPKFKEWIGKGTLGFPVATDISTFMRSSDDMILNVSDTQMMCFAKDNLGYKRDKGLDFLARIGKTYVVGEAKFLTDFGGHQNAQFNDAMATLNAPIDSQADVVPIAILDGVLYIDRDEKMRKTLNHLDDGKTVLSALLLGEFLRSLR